jgi:two-component system chemotaxis sensor kinase CheA
MTNFDLTAFYGQFRDETWDNLDLVEQGLTTLEAQPDDQALLDRMLRAIHTTKGSAKIMGFSHINRLAHRIEDVLGAVGKGEIDLTAEVGTAIFETIAAIRTLTDAQVEGQPAPVDVSELLTTLGKILGEEGEPKKEEKPPPTQELQTTAPSPLVTMPTRPTGRTRETMRVDLERVDQLARQVGEMLSLQQQAVEEQFSLYDLTVIQKETLRALEGLRDRLVSCQDRLAPSQAETLFQSFNWLENSIQRLDDQWREFTRNHDVLIERFSLALNELHQDALNIRMLPIGTLFEVFPGVVRRMAGESGVEVALEIRGSEVELDRRVLDLLREPLIHLVRNALDHGIEPPRIREAQGKSRRGKVILEAWQRGRRVHIRIQDDGKGIDPDRLRQTAVERGFLKESQAQEADRETLLNLIFLPGFSTRKQVTDISGRGVGMNIVQTTIHQLNGTIQIDTQPGKGTTFALEVPLTLATIRVLFVESSGETIAFPASAVRGLMRIEPQEIISVEGRSMFQWHEQTIPLIPLAQVLGFFIEERGDVLKPSVITGTNGRQVALTVDRIIDEAEVVVQPLRGILGRSPLFSAATISGTGRVIPILHMAGLLARKAGGTPVSTRAYRSQVQPRDNPVILLVEDAIITRELERSILEAAGYQVETAFDGLDALQKLEQRSFQLVITDIEMPRMDGFELTLRIREEPRWTDLPVIIISAREKDEDRRRGLQVGAQAYIAKSRFDQSNLLETITQLMVR